MRELRTEIESDAPPERVWQALTDFGAYPAWNPFIRSIEGGRSRFIQSERFSGLLVRLLRGTLAATERGFEQMNEALRRRVEVTR